MKDSAREFDRLRLELSERDNHLKQVEAECVCMTMIFILEESFLYVKWMLSYSKLVSLTIASNSQTFAFSLERDAHPGAGATAARTLGGERTDLVAQRGHRTRARAPVGARWAGGRSPARHRGCGAARAGVHEAAARARRSIEGAGARTRARRQWQLVPSALHHREGRQGAASFSNNNLRVVHARVRK